MTVERRRIVRHWTETLIVTLDPRRPLTEEERSETERALFVLMADYEARNTEIMPIMEEIHAALFGQRTRFASPFDRDSSNHVQKSEQIERELEQAARSGRLLIVPHARPIIRLAVTEQSVAAPELRPAPEGPLTFFEVRFVDEIGEAIADLDVIITTEGKANNLKTDGDGKARLDGVRASFASVRVSSVQALRDIVEPRWETLRPGEPPAGEDIVSTSIDAFFDSLSLTSEKLKTVVVRPALGRIFVELRSKSPGDPWAELPYEISGPMEFSGTTDADGRLLHEEVPPGDYTLTLTAEIEVGAEKLIDEFTTPVLVQPASGSVPQVRRLGALPRVELGRARGLIFETNKCFVLPSALSVFDEVRKLYARNEPGKLLLVGHTDTTADASINDPLSVERSDSVAAFLKDDVDAWLSFYGSTLPETRRWGAAEDAHMLSALPDSVESSTHDAAVRRFQRSRGLTVDGVAGPQTRRQLIAEYMALDPASLVREQVAFEVVTHGCGENFPLDSTGVELDKAPPDAEQDPLDRRTELFFFDAEFGIVPPPPGKNSAAGSTEYPEWRKRADLAFDVEVGAERSIVLFDELGAPLSFEPYELLTEDGGRIAGAADENGVVVFPRGIPNEVTLRLTALASEIELATA